MFLHLDVFSAVGRTLSDFISADDQNTAQNNFMMSVARKNNRGHTVLRLSPEYASDSL